MQAHGFVRNLKTLLIGVSPIMLAACGGNNTISVGGSSSSGSGSGGTSAFHGTFFGYSGNSELIFPPTPTQTTDTVFGVVASNGRGFFADTQKAGSQAIFNLDAASSTGSSTVSGFFDAYTANNSTLGDGTTIALNGSLSGKLSSTSSDTQAALTLTYPSTYSNSANIILDNPALAPTVIKAGTYIANAGAGSGAAAIASSALSSNNNDVYTVDFSSATNFSLSSASGCNFTGSTTIADGTYNIYLLSGVTGTCPGSSNTITLTGLASFLSANGHSPLGGALAKNTLVLELDDSQSNNGIAQYALALVATQQ